MSEEGGRRGPLDFDPDDETAARSQGRTTQDEADVPPSAPPPRRSRYGWAVALLFFAWLAYITVNNIATEGPGSRGVPPNRPLPPFAAPLALSDLQGDANVARRGGQAGAGRRPACAVRGPGVLNSCQLAERGPVVLTFYASRAGKRCERQLDVVERVRPRFPGVQFAAVAIRGDRGDLRRLIRRSGWRFPVGYDRDGAIANVYGVAICPLTILAYPGGTVMRTELGARNEGRLAVAVRRLESGARRRGWTPPTS